MKRQLKFIPHWIAILVVSPILVIYFLLRLVVGEAVFCGFLHFMSLFPGKTGSYLRVAFYRFTLQHCEFDCVIGFATLFSQPDTEIGAREYIGPQCNIGSCRIEPDCLVASGVHILSCSSQHDFSSLDVPIQQQGGTYKKITIGEDCWLGNGAIVMADVGCKSVIAAGSVIVKSVPQYSVVGGNPAKAIMSRLQKSFES